MYGRDHERDVIDRLITAAKEGTSSVLTLYGEPGMGKSRLLDYAAELAGGLRVLRCEGVETEIDLAYSGLHQLLRPVLGLVDSLPELQANGLRAALGLREQRDLDRFLVASAVLTILSEAAEERPVLCLVDDLYWLDQASADVLTFVARRLEAEGVVLLAATCQSPPRELPVLVIDGLDLSAAAALLRSSGCELSETDMARLIAETGGNPLALVQLGASLTHDQIAQRGPLPLTQRLHDAFSWRVHDLPEATRRLLLVAAADDSGDLMTIMRAATAAFGVPPAALDVAIAEGLVRMEGAERLEFRHPLIRSVVYHGADTADRLTVHRALAGAVDGHVERRVWHLAASTLGTDEEIAAELHDVGEQARSRGAHGTASAAFERCADLVADSGIRGRRLAAAAREAHEAGQLDRAAELAELATSLIDAPHDLAKLTALRGSIKQRCGQLMSAHPILIDAARQLAPYDVREAVATLCEAAAGAVSMASPRSIAETTAAFAALSIPPEDKMTAVVTTQIAMGDLAASDVTAISRIRKGVEELLSQIDSRNAVDWSHLELAPDVLIATGDHEAGLFAMQSEVANCMARGVLGQLPGSLAGLAFLEAQASHLRSAHSHATEASQLAADLGHTPARCFAEATLTWIAAVRGHADEFRRHAEETVRASEACGYRLIIELGGWGYGLLDLALGRPVSAVRQLVDVASSGKAVWPMTDLAVVPDLVEAAVRAGQPEAARDYLPRFEHWVTQIEQPWSDAVLLRSRALLADDDEADSLFRAAVFRHEEGGQLDRPYDRARTQLLYGEWLRRARRRTDARHQLTAARSLFERLGATAWSERAAAELRAAGQQVGRRDESAQPQLTPQERHIAQFAALGASNKEIGAQLFLSPRTVGYHLSNAYAKLGITSRRALVDLDL